MEFVLGASNQYFCAHMFVFIALGLAGTRSIPLSKWDAMLPVVGIHAATIVVLSFSLSFPVKTWHEERQTRAELRCNDLPSDVADTHRDCCADNNATMALRGVKDSHSFLLWCFPRPTITQARTRFQGHQKGPPRRPLLLLHTKYTRLYSNNNIEREAERRAGRRGGHLEYT